QERVEKQHFESRKHVLEYDDVMNQQRKVVYGYRREILEGGQATGHIIDELIADVAATMCATYVAHKNPTKEELADIYGALEKLTGMPQQEIIDALASRPSHEPFEEFLTIMLRERYAHFRQQIDTETIQNAEKWLLLDQVDNHWKIHLHVIDSLKEGINLRSYGQKNPLLEYKKESFDAFTNMMNAIKWDSIAHLFRIRPEHFSQSHIHELEKEREKELDNVREAGGDDTSQGGTTARKSEKVGRNEPCPCDSGKKYKQCCGKRG
ncbi:MAG: SEC-C metal-binding domain-containing protein, partial [Candidatus Dependentiae bacterium]